jgi:membrane-associated phospholipid phosphatase
LIICTRKIVLSTAALAFVLAVHGWMLAQTHRPALSCAECDAPSVVAAENRARTDSSVPPQSGDSSSRPSPINDQNSGLSVGQWLRRAADDQWRIYSGPFRSEGAIKWDILIVGGTGALIAADRHITDQLPRTNLKASRDISNIGSFTTVGSVGALLLAGVATHNPHTREAGILGVESVANGAALWAVVNTLTRRERPLEGDGRGRFWVNNGLKSSMPSAHSLLTWAAATTIAEEYPRPWVQALAYGTATAVSVTRVTGLRHFPADSFVGSVLGFFVAREMFKLHCEAGISPACHKAHAHKRDLFLEDENSAMEVRSRQAKRVSAVSAP